MPEIGLLVGGKRYDGWKTATITRTIESISGTFELGVADQWSLSALPWPIREDDEVSVVLGGKPLVTGFVDQREQSFSKDSHSISISGRDKVADLLDSSCDIGWQFNHVHLLAFMQLICAQHKIPVSVGPGVQLPIAPQETFSIDPGDKGFDVLDRVCRFAGVLPVSDGLGGIRLIFPGMTVAPVALVQGVNVLSGSVAYNHTERFAKYRVIGQGTEGGVEGGALIRGEASDPGCRRSSRILIMQAEQATSLAAARTRASWEASTRAARAAQPKVTVQGWDANGYVWTPGDLVPVMIPKLGLEGQMLIASTTMNLARGTTTEITLARPDAFLPELNPLEAWKK